VDIPVLTVCQELAYNVNGGVAVDDTWTKRILNNVVENTISGASVASNEITLPAGQYHIIARANFHTGYPDGLEMQTRIREGSNTLLISDAVKPSTSAIPTYTFTSIINGTFTIASQKVISLQYWTKTYGSNTYLGYATGSSTAGSYWPTCVTIMKIDDTIGLGATGPIGPTGPQGTVGPTGPVGLVGIGGATGAYTLALTDNGKLVDMDKATAVTLTVPKNAVVTFPIGTSIAVRQKGAGQVTIAPVDGDVTLNYPDGLKTTNQYAMAQLIKIAINTWQIYGSLET
jgi:hypothetical protein